LIVNQSTRNSSMKFVYGSGIAAACAVFNFFRWVHSASSGARFETILWAILFCISVLFGIARLLYYRTHRDYFAEEMEHRRLLAKGLIKAKG